MNKGYLKGIDTRHRMGVDGEPLTDAPLYGVDVDQKGVTCWFPCLLFILHCLAKLHLILICPSLNSNPYLLFKILKPRLLDLGCASKTMFYGDVFLFQQFIFQTSLLKSLVCNLLKTGGHQMSLDNLWVYDPLLTSFGRFMNGSCTFLGSTVYTMLMLLTSSCLHFWVWLDLLRGMFTLGLFVCVASLLGAPATCYMFRQVLCLSRW